MNNVSLIGRLTADPELKHTQSGTPMVNFRIAVDRTFVKQGEERQADFITIVAWNKTAEFICKYFAKGRRIALIGEIRTGSYTDKDGNKRYTTDVWANNVEFVDSKSDSSSTGSGENRSYSQAAPSSYRQEAPAPAPSYSNGDAGDFAMTDDEDLPF